ncbi:hypothetical protein [Massilia haematophila]|uniref:Uncharacterized protein n=1 Tax=Massilia haematophila TaxID=457923 RepID=A0ABV7PBW8_9BURK
MAFGLALAAVALPALVLPWALPVAESLVAPAAPASPMLPVGPVPELPEVLDWS